MTDYVRGKPEVVNGLIYTINRLKDELVFQKRQLYTELRDKRTEIGKELFKCCYESKNYDNSNKLFDFNCNYVVGCNDYRPEITAFVNFKFENCGFLFGYYMSRGHEETHLYYEICIDKTKYIYIVDFPEEKLAILKKSGIYFSSRPAYCAGTSDLNKITIEDFAEIPEKHRDIIKNYIGSECFEEDFVIDNSPFFVLEYYKKVKALSKDLN
jgi:hypothetical protein